MGKRGKYKVDEIVLKYRVALRRDQALLFEEARTLLEGHVGKRIPKSTMMAFLSAHYISNHEYQLSREYIQIEQASLEVLDIIKRKYGFDTETSKRNTGEEYPDIEEAGAGIRSRSTGSVCPTCGRNQRSLTFRVAKDGKAQTDDGGRASTLTLIPGDSEAQDGGFKATTELPIWKPSADVRGKRRIYGEWSFPRRKTGDDT